MSRSMTSALPRAILAAAVTASLVMPVAAQGGTSGSHTSATPSRTGSMRPGKLPPGVAPKSKSAVGDATGASAAEGGDTVRLVVKTRRGVGRGGLSSAGRKMGFEVGRKLRAKDWSVIEVPAGDADAVARELEAKGVASSVSRDVRIRPTFTPNDAYYAQQWALDNTGQNGGTAGADISAADAWDVTRGSRSVVVAVCDTGVQLTHPDLSANKWVNPDEIANNGIDDDGNGHVDDVNGWDFVHNDKTVYDAGDGDDHGTHVAGIIGAVGNNSVGTSGVSQLVSVMSVKTLGPTGGYLSTAADSIFYAVDEGAKVINHSWVSDETEPYFEQALDYAASKGVLNVAAAGNDATSLDGVAYYPASSDATNVISVASSTNTDELSYFSNWGPSQVDLAAPGSDILSLLPNDYGTMSGTSMAAPQVTGAAAMVLAAHPGAGGTEVKTRLLDTVDRPANLWGWTATDGRLNLAAAVAADSALAPSIVSPPQGGSLLAEATETVTWQASPWTAPATTYEVQYGTHGVSFGDGFESGTTGWTLGGDVPFYRTSSSGMWHAGSWGMRSGAIGDSQVSYMERSFTVPEGGGKLGFWFRLDSEDYYDWAYLTIDGYMYWWAEQDRPWTYAEIPVPEGTRTVRWAYVKDVSGSQGADVFAVDDVSLTTSAWGASVFQPAGSTQSDFVPPAVTAQGAVRVRGLHGGRVSNWAEVGGLTVGDSSAPSAPTGVNATSGDRAADVSWDAAPEPDVFEWQVWRAEGAGEFSLADTVGSTAFADSGLTNGQSYRYRIVAVDALGQESPPSDEASVTPEDVTPPSKPTGLVATPGNESISLAWNLEPDADVVGWDVWRAHESEPAEVVAHVTTRSYDDPGLTLGDTYTYSVVAVDDDGLSSVPSDEVSAQPADLIAPASPVSLQATAGHGQVSLTWTAGSEPDLAGWTVYRARGAGSFSAIGTPTSPAYTDTTAGNTVMYRYQVRARDNSGNLSAPSSAVSAIPLASYARLSGSDRYATAIAVSKASFATAGTVVLATGQAFPDALSASALAGAYGGPLLLTPRDNLPSGLTSELTRLGATNVVIVGGPAAVSDNVKNKLKASYAVTRIAGADRFGTAAAVAAKVKSLGGGTRVFVARGDTFPDALSASPIAYAMRYPVLLVKPTGVPSATSSAIASIKPTEAIVLGSTEAVPNSVKSALGVTSERWGGSDRYSTAAYVARKGADAGWASFEAVGAATGTSFPDALGGGAAIGSRGGVLLLTDPDRLSSAAASAIDEYVEDIDAAYVVGGSPAVSNSVANRIKDLLGL